MLRREQARDEYEYTCVQEPTHHVTGHDITNYISGMTMKNKQEETRDMPHAKQNYIPRREGIQLVSVVPRCSEGPSQTQPKP